MFAPNSRYFNLETHVFEAENGTQTVYVSRRFLPLPEKFELLQYYTVTESDRLDNITALYLGDPEQFWRICDANNAMRPAELEIIGRRLRITLPEGIPGNRNA
jgi:hypothetical protein